MLARFSAVLLLASLAHAQGATPAVQVDIAPLPAVAPVAAMPAPPMVGPRLHATLITHVAAGKQPTTCAIADDGKTLYVSNRGENSVSVFETDGLTVEKTFTEVGYSAWGIAVRSPTEILVANWAGCPIKYLSE